MGAIVGFVERRGDRWTIGARDPEGGYKGATVELSVDRDWLHFWSDDGIVQLLNIEAVPQLIEALCAISALSREQRIAAEGPRRDTPVVTVAITGPSSWSRRRAERSA